MNQARKPIFTLCAFALCALFSNAHAQTTEIANPDNKIQAKPAVVYNLPKQKLTAEIAYLTLLGDTALLRRHPEIAYEAYMKAAQITKDPRYAELAYKVAAVVQEPKAAIQAALLLKKLAPNATAGQDLVLSAKIATAYAYIDKQEYRPAYAAAKDLLAAEPNNVVALSLMVDVADRLGYDKEALAAAEKWFKVEPESAEAQNNLGYFLVNKNIQLSRAEALITKAFRTKPNAPHIMDSMGWLAYRQGRLDDALPYLRQAAIMEPQEEVLTHLGEVLWQKGEQAGALKAFTQAYAANAYSNTLRDTLERLGIPLHVVNTAPTPKNTKGNK